MRSGYAGRTATYQEYVETLCAAGVATPQATPGFDRPYFYDLDMGGFLDPVRAQKSWDDLGIRVHGFTNGNKVLTHATNVCRSNGAATYLGLVSYVIDGREPTTVQEALDFATKIKPLLRGQGLPSTSSAEFYSRPGGAGDRPDHHDLRAPVLGEPAAPPRAVRRAGRRPRAALPEHGVPDPADARRAQRGRRPARQAPHHRPGPAPVNAGLLRAQGRNHGAYYNVTDPLRDIRIHARSSRRPIDTSTLFDPAAH